MPLAYTNREVFLKRRVSEPRQEDQRCHGWTLGLAIVLAAAVPTAGRDAETADRDEQISVYGYEGVDPSSRTAHGSTTRTRRRTFASFGAPVSSSIAPCAAHDDRCRRNRS
jgi:hypothetical protein